MQTFNYVPRWRNITLIKVEENIDIRKLLIENKVKYSYFEKSKYGISVFFVNKTRCFLPYGSYVFFHSKDMFALGEKDMRLFNSCYKQLQKKKKKKEIKQYICPECNFVSLEPFDKCPNCSSTPKSTINKFSKPL